MRFLILTLLFCTKVGASGIDFIANDLSTARYKARQSQKLIVVKFYAKWCAPCQVMDEHVWTDPELVNYVAENCVAAKIDVDNFDGISYKQHFNIERLPTTLLLDACGNEVARFENYASANRLIGWLQMFDRKDRRVCEEGNAVALPETFFKPLKTAPGEVAPQLQVKDKFLDELNKSTEMAVAPQQKPTSAEHPVALSRPFQKQKIETPSGQPTVVSSPSAPKPRPSTPIVTGEAVVFPQPYVATTPTAPTNEASKTSKNLLWEMSRPSGFAVQVLATSTSEGAETMKSRCLSQFSQPVAVMSPQFSGDNLYRVLVGMFSNRSDAEHFRNQISRQFQGVFVRDLSKI